MWYVDCINNRIILEDFAVSWNPETGKLEADSIDLFQKMSLSFCKMENFKSSVELLLEDSECSENQRKAWTYWLNKNIEHGFTWMRDGVLEIDLYPGGLVEVNRKFMCKSGSSELVVTSIQRMKAFIISKDKIVYKSLPEAVENYILHRKKVLLKEADIWDSYLDKEE